MQPIYFRHAKQRECVSDILQGRPLELYIAEHAPPAAHFSLSISQSCRLHKACTNIRGLLACCGGRHRKGRFAQVEKKHVSVARKCPRLQILMGNAWFFSLFGGKLGGIEQSTCLRRRKLGKKITKGLLGDEAAATEDRREVGPVSLWSTSRVVRAVLDKKGLHVSYSCSPWPTLHCVVDIGLSPGRPKRKHAGTSLFWSPHVAAMQGVLLLACPIASCQPASRPAGQPASPCALPEDRKKKKACRSRSIGTPCLRETRCCVGKAVA